jgi:hypothetical protein
MIFSINAFPVILAVTFITSSVAFTVINTVVSRPLKTSFALPSSVVTEFLVSKSNSTSFSNYEDSSATQIKSFFERESLATVLDDHVVKKKPPPSLSSSSSSWRNYRNQSQNNSKRKHNYSDLKSTLKEDIDVKQFSLHSSAVTHLYVDMPINDITRAIKRAQNLHDCHDLMTLGKFLIEECDDHWGYGYRGTLLSRLAVAAFHVNEVDLARRAIQTRNTFERASMAPFESAAIVRGLLRVGLPDEAWKVVDDELRLPLRGTDLTSEKNQEIVKFRCHALSSISTRSFYQNEPATAIKALQKLADLGSIVNQSNISVDDLDLPWNRLERAAVAAASTCTDKNGSGDNDAQEDLREYVWNAKARFN